MKIVGLLLACKTPRSLFVENENRTGVRNQAPLKGGGFHMSTFSWCVSSKARGVFYRTGARVNPSNFYRGASCA